MNEAILKILHQQTSCAEMCTQHTCPACHICFERAKKLEDLFKEYYKEIE